MLLQSIFFLHFYQNSILNNLYVYDPIIRENQWDTLFSNLMHNNRFSRKTKYHHVNISILFMHAFSFSLIHASDCKPNNALPKLYLAVSTNIKDIYKWNLLQPFIFYKIVNSKTTRKKILIYNSGVIFHNRIWGIVCFRGWCSITILSLKSTSMSWERREYINYHWPRLLNDVRLYWCTRTISILSIFDEKW